MISTDRIAEMYDELDRARKSRVWFGKDVDLLNAICAAQKALNTVASELTLAERRLYRDSYANSAK